MFSQGPNSSSSHTQPATAAAAAVAKLTQSQPTQMKLDVNVLRYLSKEDFRVLTSVEMGQKNVRARQHNPSTAAGCYCCAVAAHALSLLLLQHELVPMQLIDTISGLK